MSAFSCKIRASPLRRYSAQGTRMAASPQPTEPASSFAVKPGTLFRGAMLATLPSSYWFTLHSPSHFRTTPPQSMRYSPVSMNTPMSPVQAARSRVGQSVGTSQKLDFMLHTVFSTRRFTSSLPQVNHPVCAMSE